MIEYQFYEGCISEFVAEQENGISVDKPDTNTSQDEYSTWDRSAHDLPLLNNSFYPVGIHMGLTPELNTFPNINRIHIFLVQHHLHSAFGPDPPPPRVVD
ncbi:hypothetical protein [Fodinibius salinus]|nr:hypothetical protein [Fodinibius salinus]